jgi:hypothetical protein
MIHVTDDPMEGIVVDVQDHAQKTGTIWIGTHGEMMSLNLHGAEDPIRWMLRPHHGAETRHIWIMGFASEKRRMFHQRHPNRALPRGVVPFLMEIWPWKA